jgi:hypothetical protein
MAYRVVPEFKTSSTRIKPLFAYASDVCIVQFWVWLLILTSHNDTCKFENVLGSAAIFSANRSIACYSGKNNLFFVDKRLCKFGKLFS